MQKTSEIEMLLETLRETVSRIVPQTEFDVTWRKAVEAFRAWLSGLPTAVSPLTRNLELLRIICDTFQNPSIRKDDEIAHIVAEGVVKTGEHVNLMGTRFRIIDREITDHFGILFLLVNEKGETICHEFFD